MMLSQMAIISTVSPGHFRENLTNPAGLGRVSGLGGKKKKQRLFAQKATKGGHGNLEGFTYLQ